MPVLFFDMLRFSNPAYTGSFDQHIGSSRSEVYEAVRHLEVIPFLFHFIRLRLSVAIGLFYTAEPLGISWRWRQWRYVRKVQDARKNRYRNV